MNLRPHIDVVEPGRIAAILAGHPLPAVNGWLDRTVNLTSKTAAAKRLLRTVLLATLCLAGAAGGLAADTPTAAKPPDTPAAAADETVVLDGNSFWRHFVVSRCAFARTPDGKLEPWNLLSMGLDRFRQIPAEVPCARSGVGGRLYLATPRGPGLCSPA